MTPRRPLLLPFVPLYATAQRLHQYLLDSGHLSTHTLPGVTLSVGSLSAGGAGKTPAVLALALALHQRGFPVRILSRGYGRRSSQTLLVDPAGSPADFGDEPLLLARRSGLPVIVGASRYEAGLLAATLPAAKQPVVYLLDDGFQHRRLSRDLDLVLLTAKDTEDALLPAGNLREPLSSLRRANLLLLRDDEAPAIESLLQTLPDAPRTTLRLHRALHVPPLTPIPSRPLLFSGIARPHDLPPMLRNASLPAPVHHITLPDHHRYTPATISRLVRSARHFGANGFITTEKDAVKLTAPMLQQLHIVGPLAVPQLIVTFADEPCDLAAILAHLPRLDPHRNPA